MRRLVYGCGRGLQLLGLLLIWWVLLLFAGFAGMGVLLRWGLLAAIETLFLIPVIVVVFVLQKHLLRGVTFGTIKR